MTSMTSLPNTARLAQKLLNPLGLGPGEHFLHNGAEPSRLKPGLHLGPTELVRIFLSLVEHAHRSYPLAIGLQGAFLILGPGASMAAHGHDSTAFGQCGECRVENPATHGIERHVHAAAVRETEQFRGNVLGGIVDPCLRAQLQTSAYALVGTGAGEDPRPHGVGDLDSRHADSTSGGVNQGRFSGLQLSHLEGVPSREEYAREGGGIGSRHPLGLAVSQGGLSRAVFGVGPTHQGHDLVPGFPTRHACTDRLHHTGHVQTRDSGRLLFSLGNGPSPV